MKHKSFRVLVLQIYIHSFQHYLNFRSLAIILFGFCLVTTAMTFYLFVMSGKELLRLLLLLYRVKIWFWLENWVNFVVKKQFQGSCWYHFLYMHTRYRFDDRRLTPNSDCGGMGFLLISISWYIIGILKAKWYKIKAKSGWISQSDAM